MNWDRFRKKPSAVVQWNPWLLTARKNLLRSTLFVLSRPNALYENRYPLSTALARPLIAKMLVEAAEKYGADAVAHGCTGKGNDQVRFDISIMALNPNLKVLAPAREWKMSREETIAYGERYGVESPVKKSSPTALTATFSAVALKRGSGRPHD
ncbi:argininosuccinate synthase [Synechocystis sp. B12]|nr:argininosuccinate synthase [Synechocystis sp. B12]